MQWHPARYGPLQPAFRRLARIMERLQIYKKETGMKNNMEVETNGLSGLNLLREGTHSGNCGGYSRLWFIVLLMAFLLAGCGSSSSGNSDRPTVSSLVPADLAIGVAIDSDITATFDIDIDPATLTPATFTVTGPDLTPVRGTVALSSDGLTAIFTPTSDLASNTTFTATLTTEVKALHGKGLENAKVWSFTTGTTLSPTVVSTDPPDFATGVSTDKIISATFSVAMDPLTIINENFIVTTGPKQTPVEGIVALSADGLTGTFTPTGGLTASTQFLGRVTTGVKDVSGNAMKVDKVWVFNTGP